MEIIWVEVPGIERRMGLASMGFVMDRQRSGKGLPSVVLAVLYVHDGSAAIRSMR